MKLRPGDVPQWPSRRGLMCSGRSGSRSSGFVLQVDLPDRQVVGGLPVALHLVEQFRRERPPAGGASAEGGAPSVTTALEMLASNPNTLISFLSAACTICSGRRPAGAARLIFVVLAMGGRAALGLQTRAMAGVYGAGRRWRASAGKISVPPASVGAARKSGAPVSLY